MDIEKFIDKQIAYFARPDDTWVSVKSILSKLKDQNYRQAVLDELQRQVGEGRLLERVPAIRTDAHSVSRLPANPPLKS